MLLCQLFRVPRLKHTLVRIHFLKLYAACLEISSKGWFFCMFCVLSDVLVHETGGVVHWFY